MTVNNEVDRYNLLSLLTTRDYVDGLYNLCSRHMLLYPATLDDDDYTASWQSTDEETRCVYTQRKVLIVRRSSVVPKIRAGARVLEQGGGHRQFSAGTWRVLGARAHNGALGEEPPAGSWGRGSEPLVRGSGAKPAD